MYSASLPTLLPSVPTHLKNTLGFWYLWVQLVGLDDVDIPLGLVHWHTVLGKGGDVSLLP